MVTVFRIDNHTLIYVAFRTYIIHIHLPRQRHGFKQLSNVEKDDSNTKPILHQSKKHLVTVDPSLIPAPRQSFPLLSQDAQDNKQTKRGN